jgi:hypothetical protein
LAGEKGLEIFNISNQKIQGIMANNNGADSSDTRVCSRFV